MNDNDELMVDETGRTLVNEFGLYRLMLTSPKPEAKRIVRWLCHEVLPEIRRTGSYHGSPGQLRAMLAAMGIMLPLDDKPPPECER
jgi:prophage antirepressor-like protein